jgi:WhiB family transcriptional regulator, redox-sensing transcriptional regulator
VSADVYDWREEALCRTQYVDAWYAERPDLIEFAKHVCRSCPVQSPCLSHAIEADERYGIWGGLTYLERRRHARIDADTA